MRLSADWRKKNGHPVYLLETFVETPRFARTCCRADGWLPVGQTTGRSGNDDGRKPRTVPKSIYLLVPACKAEASGTARILDVAWIDAAAKSGNPPGFNLNTVLAGSFYSPVATGENVLAWSQGQLLLQGRSPVLAN